MPQSGGDAPGVIPSLRIELGTKRYGVPFGSPLGGDVIFKEITPGMFSGEDT